MADKVIAIPLMDDTAIETAETFTVSLSSVSNGATLDGSSDLVVTLSDNDTPPPSGGGGGGGGGGSVDLLLLLSLLSLWWARARHPNRA